MKHLLAYIFLLLLTHSLYAQLPSPPPHLTCATAKKICEVSDEGYYFEEIMQYCTEPMYYSFHSSIASANLINLYPNGSAGYYRLFYSNQNTICNEVDLGTAMVVDSGPFAHVGQHSITFNQAGYYILQLTHDSCHMRLNHLNLLKPFIFFNLSLENTNYITCPDPIREEPEEPVIEKCKDCVTSFSPNAGKYMISGWVSEENTNSNTSTYTNASLKVSFSGDLTSYTIPPSGPIIDGWQRIERLIEISTDATAIHLTLQTNNVAAYFDDIRFYPLDGSMVSYVYDPINLRLMAQLDERNYATFYEYDEEGKLIRLKKETERGVMTIQENRDNIKKQ